VTSSLRDTRAWILAGVVVAASEICSALVRAHIRVLYLHWVLKPILAIANAPTDEGYFGATGVSARLLHSGLIVLAALAGIWLVSKSAAIKSRWCWVGIALFIGGAAANSFQLLATGRVLDWITFRPLAAIDLHQGFPSYSLGDLAVASGIAVLVSLTWINSRVSSRGRTNARAKDSGTGKG
jgi:lipoprotein signal peptidase